MMKNKSIEKLINENFVYAKVLDYFGVGFYESRNQTLEEVCKSNKIDRNHLIDFLDTFESRTEAKYLDLRKYPVRLIIEYLKHSHQLFVKDRLPFILKQINALTSETDKELISDLKMILPMFVDDFIHHIYEEEDRLFTYISDLEKFVNKKFSSSKIITKINSYSIQESALHHGNSDGEMKGIRGLTNNFNTNEIQDIKLRVIFQGLKAFDQELTRHANIENDILFPKALTLEKKAKEILNASQSLN